MFSCEADRPCFDKPEAYILLGAVGAIISSTLLFQIVAQLAFRRVRTHQRQLIDILETTPEKSGGIVAKEAGTVPTIVFENLQYKANGVTILNGPTGVFKPGELIAVMGGSGSGKTTLIDLLAGRRSFGSLTGHIRYNSTSLPDAKRWLRENTGYVVQEDDEKFRALTVRQVLTFAGMLKLKPTESLDNRLRHIEEVIDEFGLRSLVDVPVQDATGGLSGGQRKRLAIAKEMLRSPSIVFLDEPTSGLDSASALEIMKCLHHVASAGRIVITSIHQPRAELYELFSKIYVLSHGQTMFVGRPSDATAHFVSCASTSIFVDMDHDDALKRIKMSALVSSMQDANIPAEIISACLDETSLEEVRSKLIQTLHDFQDGKVAGATSIANPADMILDVMLGPHATPHDMLCDRYLATGIARKILHQISAITGEDDQITMSTVSRSTKYQKLKRFLIRVYIAEVRMFYLQGWWVGVQIPVYLAFDTLLFGWMYWQQESYMSLVALLYQALSINAFLSVYPVCVSSFNSLDTFVAEQRQAFISAPSYMMHQIIHHISVSVVGQITLIAGVYWMAFTQHNLEEYVWTLVLTYTFTMGVMAFYFLISVLFFKVFSKDSTSQQKQDNMVSTASIVVFLWQSFGGFFIPITEVNQIFEVATWLSPYYWIHASMMYINFKGKSTECDLTQTNCFSRSGDLVLDYYGNAQMNFAQGPLCWLGIGIVLTIVAYEILVGKRVSTQQLNYNIVESNGRVNKLIRAFSTADQGQPDSLSEDLEFDNPVLIADDDTFETDSKTITDLHTRRKTSVSEK
jgi:ABC-type multidrug transport system ATPase subunit